MNHLAQISALIGLVLPLLVAVVQQSTWSKQVRTIIGAAASIIAATVTAALAGDLSLATWATSLIAIYGAALVTYKAVWVPLGAAPWIEKATNLTKGP